MDGLLSIELREGAAVVTLERPEKRNALSIDLRVELADAFDRLSGDEETGAIVLTGAGSAFCAGMDTTQFGGDVAHRERLVETSLRAFDAVRRCAKPVIAAINGPALAGGFALALLCDVRIAAAGARMGFAELPRGIPPAYAAIRSVAGHALAAELCLTGRVLEAGEAHALGLVAEVHEGTAALERARELAAEVARRSRWAIMETKRRMLADREATLGALFAEEERSFRRALLEGPPEPAA